MQYSIGEIEELTGVKAHVLRYWEEIIPGFSPMKDIGGRRVYSQKELEMVVRLKHLIVEKKFTIEGARDQIIAESEAVNNHADLLMQMHEIRSELNELYLYAKKNKL
ncbi:MAG: MerR family transcriptional regulator [Treponema sp.]|jgi:DNA-binding transcriptional MerR regulator|nr:MerR family transcriptional regulator [Treponema sp.]